MKSVNDQFGHNVGDQVLQIVADRFRNVIREGDLLVPTTAIAAMSGSRTALRGEGVRVRTLASWLREAWAADGRVRLLDGTGVLPVDRVFRDLPGLLQPGDLLVFNDTQVVNARLFG